MQALVDHVLAGLDTRQRTAATLGPGPAQIIAPAGSGKTATLVARIGVLIAKGVPPARILVVTFNRDAASELSRRIHSVLRLVPGGSSDEPNATGRSVTRGQPVTERCTQRTLRTAEQLGGQFEREAVGWWATLDSNH